MARKTSVDFEKTKQRILEVGVDTFRDKGYNATGLQEIAKSAEISKGSFYSYFESKEDFCVGVIRFYTEAGLKAWIGMLDDAAMVSDAYTAVKDTFMKVIDHYKLSEVKKECLLGTLAAEISETSQLCCKALDIAMNQYIDVLEKYIAIAQSEGKVRKDCSANDIAGLIWDGWQGGLLRMKITNSIEPVKMDMEILFQGILAL